MKFYVLTFLSLLFLILGGYYSRDITQKNSEYLFQTKEDIRNYQQFQNNFSKEQQIVVNLKKKIIDEIFYQQLQKTLINLRQKWKVENVEFIDFYTIYEKGIKSNSFKDVEYFSLSNPRLLFDFFKKNEITFLVILGQELDQLKIEDLIYDLKKIDDNISYAGLPITNHLLNKYSEDIKTKIFPIMLMLAFVILVIMTRSLIISLINLYPSLASLVMTLTVIKFYFGSLNMVTAIAPLLIFTLSLSISFHVFYGIEAFDSYKKLIEYKLKPIFLMVITTSIGFGSLCISVIESIKQFALLCSLLILFTAVWVILWYYIMFGYLKKRSFGNSKLKANVYLLYQKYFSNPSLKIAVFSSLIIFFTGMVCVLDIKVLTDATRYLPDESMEKRNIDYITDHVWGNPNYEVLIKKKKGNELEYPDYIRIKEIEDKINHHFSSSKILSINQFVLELNRIYSKEDTLPSADIAFYTLKGQINSEQQEKYQNNDLYRVSVFGPHINHDQFLIDKIFFEQVRKEFKDFEINLNGLQFSMLKAQEYLISTLVISFISSLLIIAVLFAVIMREKRTLLPFIIVNIVPMASSFIFMKLMNYSLNIATVMTFSISLGLIVDSTIHMIYDRLNGVSPEKHLQATINPIVWGQVILIVCFNTFALNSFLPIKQTGGILAFTLSIALIFDLYHLPAMLKNKNEHRTEVDFKKSDSYSR